MRIIIDFFFLQLTQTVRGKDEQKEICFFSLQDFKKKTLELVLPTGNTMHGKWSKGKQKPSSFEMLLVNYEFFLFSCFFFFSVWGCN